MNKGIAILLPNKGEPTVFQMPILLKALSRYAQTERPVKLLMPCNLVILGKDLDIDKFLTKSKLRGFTRIYKGEPMFKSKPEGRKVEHSRVAIQTSKADFNELDKQIKDTIRYLKKHKDKLTYIKQVKEIDLALLDFGINLRIDRKKVLLQSDRFPNELLKLAGELGLDIELSVYPIDTQSILAKQQAKTKRKSA